MHDPFPESGSRVVAFASNPGHVSPKGLAIYAPDEMRMECEFERFTKYVVVFQTVSGRWIQEAADARDLGP